MAMIFCSSNTHLFILGSPLNHVHCGAWTHYIGVKKALTTALSTHEREFFIIIYNLVFLCYYFQNKIPVYIYSSHIHHKGTPYLTKDSYMCTGPKTNKR